MDSSSSVGQEAKSTHSADQRQDARFRVASPVHHKVRVMLGHFELQAECVDYSPFGLGLRFPVTPDLPLFSIGDSVDLDCDFVGSRFRARGAIANTRIERTGDGDFVRLGIALSRSAEVVRPSHVKRRSARIQMSENVSPLVAVSDELRFGETIYGKMTDISQGGMRLIIDRHPLPFLEKQRHWFDVLLPVFGQCRVYCRLAYVRREENSTRYVVGCEFIDGGGEENVSALEDWLFFSNFWLSLEDIRAAGFGLPHLKSSDERHRVLISPTGVLGFPESSSPDRSQSSAHAEARTGHGDQEFLDVSLQGVSQECRISAVLAPRDRLLILESARWSESSPEVLASVWKGLLIFCMSHHVERVSISSSLLDSSLFKSSFALVPTAQHSLSLKVDDILVGTQMRFWVWRRIYRDLSSNPKFKLPRISSFLRRMFLV